MIGRRVPRAIRRRFSGLRLEDPQLARRRPQSGWSELARDHSEPFHGFGPKSIEDPGRAALGADPAGFAQDLEVVTDRRLGDVAAGREVARADLVSRCQLPRIASRVGSAAPWRRRASGSVTRFMAELY